jgi:hypothetical protein
LAFESDTPCKVTLELGEDTEYGLVLVQPDNAQRSWLTDPAEAPEDSAQLRVTSCLALLAALVAPGKTYHYRLVLEDQLGNRTETGDSTVALTGGPASYFVSPVGEDVEDRGTRERPWQTVQFAVDRALPGDRVVLLPGLYPGETVLTHGGIEGAPVTIEAEEAGTAILDSRHHASTCLRLEQAPRVVIKGLEVRWFGKGDTFYSYDKAGIAIQGSPDVSVLECRIRNDFRMGWPIASGIAAWDSLAPYLGRVASGAIVGPPLAALRRFFDAEALTKDNYVALTEKMRAHNQPGLYERLLRDACSIDTVLNQNLTMWQTDIFRPILFESSFIGDGTRRSLQEALAGDNLDLPSTLSAYVERMEELLARRKQEGLVGVKGYCFPYQPGVAADAGPAYERLVAGRAGDGDGTAVLCYLRDRMYGFCGRMDLVAVLHSGIWAGNWADIVSIRPTHVTALACAHRRTRFDLFHAASPQPADAGFLGRSLPNVHLNSCWSHLLSPNLTLQAWDMWLDMLPINRVMAWGGDYWWAVENVWGVLDKVRQMLAELLARRIARGDFGEARALEIARRWMHDNAREVYFLDG